MAYSHPSLQRVGPANSDAPTVWTYSTVDTDAQVAATDYFLDAIDDLTLGDMIIANVDTDGTPAFTQYRVTSLTATSVDVTAA